MNREQQRYFVKRTEEIKNKLIFNINSKYNEALNNVTSVEQRVLALFKKNKKEVAKQLYDAVVAALEGRDEVEVVKFYCRSEPYGDSLKNVALPFSASCIEEYKAEKKELIDERDKCTEVVRERAKKLIDTAMFCAIPEEFADMLDRFERGA